MGAPDHAISAHQICTGLIIDDVDTFCDRLLSCNIVFLGVPGTLVFDPVHGILWVGGGHIIQFID